MGAYVCVCVCGREGGRGRRDSLELWLWVVGN